MKSTHSNFLNSNCESFREPFFLAMVWGQYILVWIGNSLDSGLTKVSRGTQVFIASRQQPAWNQPRLVVLAHVPLKDV